MNIKSILTGIVFFRKQQKNEEKDITQKSYEDTVINIDGDVYHTITIGTQVWMVENLKTTKYRNGDHIPIVTDSKGWKNIATGAYCNYDNDPDNITTYGKLYNWHAVNDPRGLAPKGWHIPTDDEWTILTTYLGGENLVSRKLKESGTKHWVSPNTGSTNKIGFTALPGGYRYGYGTFFSIGCSSYWWCSTESRADDAWYRNMYYNLSNVGRDYLDKNYGFSVRCIRD